MATKDQKKSGGSKKIGRNKSKCETYRFTKGRKTEGSKRPKGLKSRAMRRMGYMIDSHRRPEATPRFIPVVIRPHLCNELAESAAITKGALADKMRQDAESLSRSVMPPLRPRLTAVNKQTVHREAVKTIEY